MEDTQRPERKGPARQRLLILILNVVLAILVYWLLGFLIDDIGNQPGPDYQAYLKKYQDPALVKQRDDLSKKDTALTTQIDNARQQQNYLQKSISSYKDTTNQLLEIQRSSLQKGVSFSTQSQTNLANVTNLYLQYQQKYQDLNNQISARNLEQQQLRNQLSQINTQLDKQATTAFEDQQKATKIHNLFMAGLKLLVLIPILLIVLFLYRRYKETIYKNMILAVTIAVLLKIAQVMHEHFPSRFFKYILIIVLLYLVIRALISMLRSIESPKKDWLLKQYKEAYQKLLCPECQYPIQPGIMKFFTPRSQSLEKAMDSTYLQKIDQYSCPSCGTHLFEPCVVCQQTRYSLLKYCDHCGAEKT